MELPKDWPTREMIVAGADPALIPTLTPMQPFTQALSEEILVKRFKAMLAAAPEPVTVIDGFAKQDPSTFPTTDEHNALLLEQVEELREVLEAHRGNAQHLLEENIALKAEIHALKTASSRLADDLEAVDLDSKRLTDEIDALKAENAVLKAAIPDGDERVYACLTACVGFTTDDINGMSGTFMQIINRLGKERDEMVNAAKEFIDYFNPGADVDLSLGQMMAFLQQYENKLRTTLDNAKTPR